MGKTLDRNRKAGIVYGHDEYKFCQDGQYFDNYGNLCGAADTPKSQPDKADTGGAPEVVELTEDNSKRIKKLNKMSVPALKKLATALSEQMNLDVPEGGKGAKGRYVRFLVDNTTD